MRFQGGYEKDLTSNQLTIVIVDTSPMAEESDVPTIYVIPGETINLDKGH